MTELSEQQKEKEKNPVQDIEITGRFDQYRSSYWAAMLAAFGIRYPVRTMLRAHEHGDFNKKHAYSAVAGGLMEGVTLLFAANTWKDMHNIFAQSLAWEFHKDRSQVGFSDFLKSKNTMVQQTTNNYLWFAVKRALVNGAFFLPFIAKPLFKGASKSSAWHPDNWHWETGADLGLGANAGNLFLDVMGRKMTPFEALQSAIDRKINHAENASDQMTAEDLFDIYERHAANGKIGSFSNHRGTPEWDRSMAIFERMANLINQTYGNIHTQEKSDFGVPKFIYLVGHKLIQPENPERTLSYIEVANRYGVPVLQDVVKNVDEGMDLASALQRYPITVTTTVAEPQETARKFTDSVPQVAAAPKPKAIAPATYTMSKNGDKNFVERIGDKAMPPAASMDMSA